MSFRSATILSFLVSLGRGAQAEVPEYLLGGLIVSWGCDTSKGLKAKDLLSIKPLWFVGGGGGTTCRLMVLRLKSPSQGLRARKDSWQHGPLASHFLCVLSRATLYCIQYCGFRC